MHIRCPHCRNPIEVVDDDQLQDLTCPSCGSSFNLLPDETISRQTATRRTLGRFELVERIGVGAFGEVWTARDSELDRIVAIKMPRKDQLTGHNNRLYHVNFDPDGRRLLTTSVDGTCRIWRAANREEVESSEWWRDEMKKRRSAAHSSGSD